MFRFSRPRIAIFATLASLAAVALAPPVAAQGSGSTGAELLKIPAGARAAAFAGAYTAVRSDPDAIFYNPAAAGWLTRAVGLGYQAYVEDVRLGSFSAAYDLGPVVLGGGVVFLDAGTVDEIVPDPQFGGQTGMPTGETASAGETVARVAAGLPLLDRRATVGAALGFVTSNLAGVERSAPFLDLGAQFRVADLTIGASARNIGGSLSNETWGDAPLPLEARLGAAYGYATPTGYGATATADLILGIEDETTGFAFGAEAGLMGGDAPISAVLRAGIELGESEEHLGRIRVGGGIGFAGVALDYTLQNFEFLGPIHRIGLRWTAP